ncbi:multicopper oxidase domain-containing protein [Phycicoccus sonneratiae]|uniref:Multicopper oxidase domain-containing protein n=1 Tax=Phycicoccus sonneratiae TaxID=2807628 RepID=A0ABS2CJJ6_9MICO|nr:multicopper oxidase domain-containing protein [Phycicoccus sonneraticus]MBM6400013.1 multicopper oxidase domain-containing protein [Phycicoccus sonneraticus]
MTKHVRTAVLTTLAGGALTVLGLLLGPAGSASADTVDIHLDATQGTTTLPAKGGTTTSVPVWGFCRRADAGTACGGVDAPGGPVLSVTAGDEVTITLHNTLGEATSLQLGGQAIVPDTVGAPGGGTTSYTFTAGRPGTYLYEAGLTPNHQHQVAMGLYGALVVHPATAGQAYDASTTYDAEGVLVLGEIDPLLNGSSNPAAFDMRTYAPRWTLVNGKVHPAAAHVAASSGDDVLLRWVNAGTSYRSMAVLGADQRVVGLDGNRLANGAADLSRRLVADTVGPGQTEDVIVGAPTTTTDRRLAVYDASLSLHNTNAAGAGGMLTFIDVAGAGSPTDDSGPATTGVTWDKDAGTVTATVSDAATGGAAVTEAELRLDSIGATPVAMTGTFGTPSVEVTGPADIVSGQHVLYVRGRDANGAWGPWSSVLVVGNDVVGPTTTGVSLTPDRSNGSAPVVIGATGDDSASGNGAITGGRWSLDAPDAATTAMTLETDGPVASLTGTIPAATVAALPEGQHTVLVATQDESGNWGPTTESILVVDRTGPTTSDVSVDPSPNNGTLPVNASSSAVRVTATVGDPASGTSGGPFGTAQSPVTKAEAFVDTAAAGAAGTGVPVESSDGAFTTPTEAVYLDIPLATVRLMSEGSHTIWVRGRDAAGNWGTAVSVQLVIDKTAPTLGALALTPNPTAGALQATLSGTVGTDPSGPVSVEYFVGTDPGVGRGTAVVPSATGTFSAGVDTRTLPEGANRVVVRARDAAGNVRTATATLTVTRPLWFSTLGALNPTGVTGTARTTDVYRWSGTAASRGYALNAAPYNVPAAGNVDGFARGTGSQLYVSFSNTVTVPGLGQVQPRDVIRWTGTAWAKFLDGSDRGLGTATTNVDAFSVVGNAVYFSLADATRPTGVVGFPSSSAIYRWAGGTANTYTMAIAAAASGIPAAANVDGFVWLGANDWAFSLAATTTNLPGLANVADEDVVRRTNGTWSTYFDGSTHGLGAANGDVDAFSLP